MLSWQATNFLDGATHADWTPTWCQDNSGSLQIPESECDVLLDLYLATDGDNWYNSINNNNKWFQWDGSNICWSNWYGISGCERSMIDGKYHIQSINLDNNNLSWTLAASIYTLPNLSQLYIKDNPNLDVDIDDLTQSIYASNYTAINISNNIIYGDITQFSNLSNLEYLDVGCYWNAPAGNCRATGDTSFVPSLPNLYAIKVGYNTGFTFDLSDLSGRTNIREIFALETYIVGDMDVLASNTGMTTLDLGCWEIYWGGRCNVSGHMSTLTNMMDLQYLSLDGLLNIEGTLEPLYNKTRLNAVDLSHNSLTGIIGTGIGNLTGLWWLDLDDNLLEWTLPVEMYNLTQLTDLWIEDNLLSGALLDFSLFPVLEWLHIGKNSDIDYSNVWDMVLNYNLRTLDINQADIGWEIPDIWDDFTNLTELDLGFARLSGPMPASWASLTNLQDLGIHFNNLEGPIPSFLDDLQLDQGKFQIESNCLDTDVSDNNLLNYLQAHAQWWNNQLNCRANVEVEGSLDENGLVPGTCSTYTIAYENLWPQKAIDLEIAQIFDENLIISGSVPPYSTGLVGRTYGTLDDPCYVSGTQYGTGPYYAWLDNLMVTNYEIPSLYSLAVYQWGFTGAQGTTELDLVLDTFCPFIFGTDDHSLCFLLFGSSFADVDPSCGTGGEAGYVRDLWTIADGWTGSIEVELCVPEDLTGSVSFSSKVSTVSTNENEESPDDNFQFMIQNPGDDEVLWCTDPDADNYDPLATDDDNSCEYPEDNGGNNGGNNTNNRNSGPNIVKDKCLPNPPGDKSSSYYDGECDDTSHNSADTSTVEEEFDPKSYLPDLTDVRDYVRDLPAGTSVDVEQIKAFLFAKRSKLTNMMDYMSFRPDEDLTRWTWAKFLVAFIENVLQQEADASRLKLCSNAYSDISGLWDIKDYIIKACMHKIMWLENNGTDPLSTFNPHAILTRKDLVTTANRFINGNRDDGVFPYRAKHMQVMNDIGLIRNTDPEIVESRMNAITILMRALEQYDEIFADK